MRENGAEATGGGADQPTPGSLQECLAQIGALWGAMNSQLGRYETGELTPFGASCKAHIERAEQELLAAEPAGSADVRALLAYLRPILVLADAECRNLDPLAACAYLRRAMAVLDKAVRGLPVPQVDDQQLPASLCRQALN